MSENLVGKGGKRRAKADKGGQRQKRKNLNYKINSQRCFPILCENEIEFESCQNATTSLDEPLSGNESWSTRLLPIEGSRIIDGASTSQLSTGSSAPGTSERWS